MLEMQGVFLVALLLTKPVNNSLRLQSILITALLFTKYSFGLFIIAAKLLECLLKKDKSILTVLLVPAILFTSWCLFAEINSIKAFFLSHPSYTSIGSIENLFFYPKAFVSNFLPSKWLSLIMVPIFILGLYNYKENIFAVALFFSTLFILTFSTTNEVRHFLVAMPALLFILASGISRIINLRIFSFSLFPLVFLAVVIGSLDLNTRLTLAFEGENDFSSAYSELNKVIETKKPLLACGLFDQFGREALIWEVARRNNISGKKLVIDSYPFSKKSYLSSLNRNRNIPSPWIYKELPAKPLNRIIDTNFYETYLVVEKKPANDIRAYKCKKLLEKLKVPSSVIETKNLKLTVFR